MTDARMPSLDLVRAVTDRYVVDQLLTGPQTRAEIAARTKLSKPTVSQSVRRLSDAGLLVEAGPQTGGRGRAGTYYRLRPDLGSALAVSVAPEGVVVEALDVLGEPVARTELPGTGPTAAAELAPRLQRAVAEVVGSRPVLAAVMSLAGPVDRRTGRLVELPDPPFLTGTFDPVALLADVAGTGRELDLKVDNDVNWAAVAEHRDGAATGLDSFVHLYLGPGLGAGLVVDGAVVRGHAGVAGEISHVRTVGPDDRSRRLIEVFGALGLLRAGSNAVDVPRLAAALTEPQHAAVAESVVRAVAGVVGSLTALVNPEAVVVGGPWSTVGDVGLRIAAHVHADAAVDTVVKPAALGLEAPLVGVRSEAVRLARQAILGDLAG